MSALAVTSVLTFIVSAAFGMCVVATVSYISGSFETGLVGLVVGIFLIVFSTAVEILFWNEMFDLLVLDANASGMFYAIYGIEIGVLSASVVSITIGAITSKLFWRK